MNQGAEGVGGRDVRLELSLQEKNYGGKASRICRQSLNLIDKYLHKNTAVIVWKK